MLSESSVSAPAPAPVAAPAPVSINQNNNTNPYSYIDAVIGAEVIHQLNRLNGKNAITITNIGILIATISLWEIKGVVSEGVKFIKKNLYPGIIWLREQCKNLSNISNISHSPSLPIVDDHHDIDNNYCCFQSKHSLQVIPEFMDCLYIFLTTPTTRPQYQVHYSVLPNYSRQIVNLNTEVVKRLLNRIRIVGNDFEFQIKEAIEFEIESTKGVAKCKKASLIKDDTDDDYNIQDKNAISDFADLIHDLFVKNALKLLFNHIKLLQFYVRVDKPYEKIKEDLWGKLIKESKESIYGLRMDVVNPYVLNMTIILKYNFPKLEFVKSYLQLLFITSICYCNYFKVLTPCKDRYEKFLKDKKFFGYPLQLPILRQELRSELTREIEDQELLNYSAIELKFVDETLNIEYNGYFMLRYDTKWRSQYLREDSRVETFPLLVPPNYQIIWNEIKFKKTGEKISFVPPVNLLLSKSTTSTSTKITIELICESMTIQASQHEDLLSKMLSSIKDCKASHNQSANIEINHLKLVKNVKTDTKQNPEYLEYQEKKKLVAECPDKAMQNMGLSEIFKMNVPSENLTTTTIESSVEVELIQTSHKSIDTMYFKQQDEKKLMSVIEKFHSKKDLLHSLGLPNKLCILLNGPPGTGKSSAILTIASYLQKNIYYFSFENVRTNDDMNKMVNHVVKNCNEGIVVIEDIDAIGDFVLARNHDYVEITTSETILSNTKELSLAYFLNLLQGTITPDGLVFIATTNHLDKLDPAFYRDGRFDVKITMTEADAYQLQKIYKQFIGRPIPDKFICQLEDKRITPATFIFTIKDYICDEYTDEEILSSFLN